MTLYYAERLGGPGEPYIAERGIFLSIEEFAPYRAKGWEGTKETNAAADAFLQEQAIREIGCTSLGCNYPMCDCGFEGRTWADEMGPKRSHD